MIATALPFEVLGSRWVITSRQGIMWHQSHLGQLTKCRMHDGTLFYVREGLDSSMSFYISSGQRQGEKDGHVAAERQVLLLATDGDWDEIAAAVRRADSLHRAVVRNARFTVASAEAQFSKGRRK